MLMKPRFYRIVIITVLLVFGVICVLSYNSFKNAEEILYSESKTRKQMIEESIYGSIEDMENASRIIDTYFGSQLKKYSEYMLEKYQDNPDVLSWDLKEMKKEFDGCDIYIISEDLVVVNTTFAPDQNLDFKRFKNFRKVLEKRLEGEEFVTDIIDYSTNTGSKMKYSYMPTPDHKYLFELSIDVGKKFPGLNVYDFDTVRDEMLKRYPAVKWINIYKFNSEGVPVMEISQNKRKKDLAIAQEHLEVIKDAIIDNETREIEDKKGLTTYRYIPYNTYLATGEVDWWNSYLIQIVYDDSKLMQKIGTQRKIFVSNLFLVIFVFTVLILILLYYFRKLEEVRSQLATVIDKTSEGYCMIDLNYNIKEVNQALCSMLGYEKEEIINYNIKSLLQDEGLNYDSFLKGIDNNRHYMHEAVLPAKDGREVNVIVKATLVQDKPDKPLYAFAFISDITERKLMYERLRYMSLHDNLTGLYNRAFFEQKITEITEEDYPLGIIVCDVDGLKLVNDTLGHKKGDELLIAASDVIKKACQNEANMSVARIGGDEFAVLALKTPKEGILKTVDRIREEVKAYNLSSSDLVLSISTGSAWGEGLEKGVNELFKEADNNMYREKLYQRQSVRSAIIGTLKKAMEERDLITEGHGERLQRMAADFSRYLGLPEEKINEMRLLAQFHDIGKVGIPDRILFKVGDLTSEEKREMERHSEIGYRIASASPDLLPVADFILKHHEWWDGNGYPLGLKGEEIPLECRILAICDAYDAMTNNRPYRQEMSEDKALEVIREGAGVQFDPVLVDIFCLYIEKKGEQVG